MKKKFVLWLLCILTCLLCAIGVACTKKPNEDKPGSEEKKTEYTVSGLSGNGYRLIVDGQSGTGNVKVEKGKQISFQVALETLAAESNVVVKIGDETLTADASGKYTYTVNSDVSVSVEGIVMYSLIRSNPLMISATETTADVATGLSSLSNSFSIASETAMAPTLANMKIEKYTSLIFYMKCVNGGKSEWIMLKNGEVAKANADGDNDIYGNALSATDTSQADNIWHKFKFTRNGESGSYYWDMTVDDAAPLWSGQAVNAKVSRFYNYLFSLNINGDYLISELFGIEDSTYVEEPLVFDIVEDYVFGMPDTLIPAEDDTCCKESYNVSKYSFEWTNGMAVSLNVKLAKYKALKFYVRCDESDSYTQTPYLCLKYKAEDGSLKAIKAGGANIETEMLSHSEWHEIYIENDSGVFSLYYDGQITDYKFTANLNELYISFNEAQYRISELFGAADPDYVGSTFEVKEDYSYSADFVKNTENLTLPDDENSELLTAEYTFTAADWVKKTLTELNLVQFKEAYFYVKITGEVSDSIWLAFDVDSTAILQDNKTAFHKISFVKNEGYIDVYVDDVKKATITNMAQLSVSFNAGGNYLFTQLFVSEDEDYNPVTITLPAGTGYSTSVQNVYAKDGTITLDVGTEIVLSVKLESKYNKSTPTLTYDGKAIVNVNDTFTLTLTDSTEMVIGNVVENSGEIDLGDYVIVSKYAMAGKAEKDESTENVEKTMSSVSIKVTHAWSGTPQEHLVSFNENKYTEIKFFLLKTDSDVNGWFVIDGTNSDWATNTANVWHEFVFTKGNDGWTLTLNGKKMPNTLSTLSGAGLFCAGTYYMSELFGIEDKTYTGITLTLPSDQTGYTIVVEGYTGTSIEAAKGTTITFTLTLDEGYSESTAVVKANGEVLTAADGKYTVTLNADTTITVEGVEKNAEKVLVVLSNPIAKAATSTDATDKKTPNYTNVIAGGWAQKGTAFNSLDLVPYSQLTFYVKADGAKWFELKDTATFSVDLGSFNDTAWHAFYLVKENNSWRVYKDSIDEAGWKNLTITNLGELSAQLGDGGTFYVSELVAVADPTYVDPYTVISSNPFTKEGTTAEIDAPSGYSTVTALTTSWDTYQFNSTDISGYSEVSFAVKSSGYYGVMFGGSVIGETNGNGEWLVIKFVKTGENTWTLYYGATEQQTLTLANNNLTDLTFRFGTDTFYVTELKGKKA